MYGQPGQQPPMGFIPPGQGFGAPTNPAQHQFGEIDRAVFSGLADNIRFVSIAGIILGALGSFGGLANLASHAARNPATLVSSLGFLVQGITLMKAQERFKAVANGAGDGVRATLEGLASLRPYYLVMLVTTAVQLLTTVVEMVR